MVWLAAALAACAGGRGREPAEPARLEARDPCQVARDADFEGAGAAQLRRYADWLARAHGTPVGLAPQALDVGIVRGPPKPGLVGVTAGEVACAGADHDARYRITLYRDALVGRPLAIAYQTVAHEFQHVVQIRRDRLPCGARDDAVRARYEREAAAAAEALVPACRAVTAGAASAGR